MLAVSVIVPAWNASGTIGDALAALSRQDLGDAYEVVVVDDGSDDGTAEQAQRAPGPVRVVRQVRRGPAEARNRGVREARGEALAFTDADCFPRPDWLRQGLTALRRADLVQGAVRPAPGTVRRPFDRSVWVAEDHGLYETANLFATRELFARVGGFEDWLQARIGKPLAEDVWFGWKARRAGARTEYCPHALVHHAVFPRSVSQYLAERRRLVYFPAMVAKIPELRSRLLYRRLFLSRRSAALDAALAGLAGASIAARLSRPRAGAALLLCSAPYLRIAYASARPWGRRAPKVAAAELAADLIGVAALAWGSVRRGAPVL